MEFIIPKDPRLFLRMLHPRVRVRPQRSNGAAFYFVPWGRNAIYHGVRALGISPGESVLVPSFHCAALVGPILKHGARVTFYNVRKDGSPDLPDIEAKIDEDTRALLVVHYFGYPQPMKELQELCAKRRLYLIEDCAHVLVGETEGRVLGSFGDISIFSWRKFLPLFDGGLLVLNNARIKRDIRFESSPLRFRLRAAKSTVDKMIEDSDSSAAKMAATVVGRVSSAARRFSNRGGYSAEVSSTNGQGSPAVDFDASLVNASMSGLSKYIMRRNDFTAIVQKRNINCRYLHEALSSLSGVVPFFPAPAKTVCPWVFPLVVPSRRDFHLLLRERGIPAVTWGGVIHPTLPIAEFPAADFLYHNVIFLPLHQDLHESELEMMVRAIKESLSGAGAR